MTKIPFHKRSVEIFGHEGEFHVERADGSVTVALSPKEALRAIRKDDKQISRTQNISVITTITWVNCPGITVDSVRTLAEGLNK